MKLRSNQFQHRARFCGAATLIECLVYIGVFATLLGVSTSALYHCYDHMRSLRRNADEITHMLRIGEIWRSDVRQAITKPSVNDAEQTLHIVQQNQSIDYRFTENQVLRRVGVAAAWTSILTNLNQSQMRLVEQTGVVACRWEVELKPLRKPARVQPLFTFTAVPETLPQP